MASLAEESDYESYCCTLTLVVFSYLFTHLNVPNCLIAGFCALFMKRKKVKHLFIIIIFMFWLRSNASNKNDSYYYRYNHLNDRPEDRQ